jgi:hypothetical protein
MLDEQENHSVYYSQSYKQHHIPQDLLKKFTTCFGQYGRHQVLKSFWWENCCLLSLYMQVPSVHLCVGVDALCSSLHGAKHSKEEHIIIIIIIPGGGDLRFLRRWYVYLAESDQHCSRAVQTLSVVWCAN